MNPNSFHFTSGIGFDVHAFESCDDMQHIRLCGLSIPSHYRVLAHSDGDVALHALVDAMLGAIGAGDIGEHFPPTDMRWKNADSTQFVTHALSLFKERQAVLINADITIICESPKLTPHKPTMKNVLASILKLRPENVNIKATTTEKLGFLGRSEGIAAQAIVSVKVPAHD
ncbi:MAG: 2-C-methyl-D-erythritol 2,4-cyclodiphosphate synthase [Coxiellaceae bacterium]|nr:2-C-methyl-D-erythritol 2,4-cyclodiphosphate synthase [Coxiellaceae bacterium]